jgi:hypothetical protein
MLEEGKFISGNSITGHNAEPIRDARIIRGNGNRNTGIHNISNSRNQRTLRQFFIRPDLFIEIRDESATFRPELQVPKTQILRQHLNVRIVNRGKG